MIKGLVLLIAVAFDVLNKMKGRPSLIGLLLPGRSKMPTLATEDPALIGKTESIQDTV